MYKWCRKIYGSGYKITFTDLHINFMLIATPISNNVKKECTFRSFNIGKGFHVLLLIDPSL